MVVLVVMNQQQGSLALGNLMSNSIANVLGPLSLGLLCTKQDTMGFDQGSRIHTAVLAMLTMRRNRRAEKWRRHALRVLLAQSSSRIDDSIGLSSTVTGTTILVGSRHQPGVLIANTVGSNLNHTMWSGSNGGHR